MKPKDRIEVIIEGVDGCGKSTLISMLQTLYGGKVIKEKVQCPTPCLLSGESITQSHVREYLRQLGITRRYWGNYIESNPERIIYRDRFTPSTEVYQGMMMGALDEVRFANAPYTGKPEQVVVYLRVSPMVAYRRLRSREDPELNPSEDYVVGVLSALVRGYDDLAQRENYRVVNADNPFIHVLHHVESVLGLRGLAGGANPH